MASHERETLLPGELFQDHDVFSEENNHSIMVSPKGLRGYESISVSCGSSYSSWSDLSSPFGSELESTSESTESEDEGFISELTRRMAESMLQDDDDDDEEIQDQDNSISNCVPESSESDCKSSSVCYYNSHGFMSKSETPTSDSTSTVVYSTCDDNSTVEQLRPVHVYELKNQPHMTKQGSGYGGGRRVKATDSTQQLQQHNNNNNNNKEHQHMQNRGKAWKYGGHGKKSSIPPLHSPQAGSGMRAVFLGGSERNGSTGTGVFLPSGNYTTPQPKRKSGCSTVLIPARVLQTLQQHFNTVGGMSTSNTCGRNDVLARINGLLSQQKEHAEFHPRPASSPAETNPPHDQDVQLPQEWTY